MKMTRLSSLVNLYLLFFASFLPFLHVFFICADSERDNPEFYEPTNIELQQGIAFPAPNYWGVHVRRSKSLRVAFIGGSQTSRFGYVDSFHELMKDVMINRNWSLAVYNEGLPGTIPRVRGYKFLSMNVSKWPNVICFEPCINCISVTKSDYIECSVAIDNVKYFINRRYKEVGLDPPYYMFLEFFEASEAYWEFSRLYEDWTSPTRIALPLNATKALDIGNPPYRIKLYRGSVYAPYMMDMARFYGMPVLSVADVLYPSWVRFFLTHADNERWPCTDDGYHTSVECAKLVAEHILKPFFLDQMTARESDQLYEESTLQFSPYPIDLRMFRADQYNDVHILGKTNMLVTRL